MRRSVYEFCDKASTAAQIRSALGSVSDSEVESILASFVQARLMLHRDGRYLSLAVNARPNIGKVPRIASGGYVKRGYALRQLLIMVWPIFPGRRCI